MDGIILAEILVFRQIRAQYGSTRFGEGINTINTTDPYTLKFRSKTSYFALQGSQLDKPFTEVDFLARSQVFERLMRNPLNSTLISNLDTLELPEDHFRDTNFSVGAFAAFIFAYAYNADS